MKVQCVRIEKHATKSGFVYTFVPLSETEDMSLQLMTCYHERPSAYECGQVYELAWPK